MPPIRPELERQLRRQVLWLKESWLWILENKLVAGEKGKPIRLSALDVGCGPGFVMDLLSPLLRIKGVDISADMVNACRTRNLDVTQAAAEHLPFEDNSFDLVYCSFFLLWVNDPRVVISEMKRVSRRWVACLAEPDFGARIDYPDELSILNPLIADGIRKDGGDPFIGRKLRSLFSECGLTADIGIHPGVWSLEKLRVESEDEWRWLEMTAAPDVEKLEKARRIWKESIGDGRLFQFNPIFYAIAKK